MTTTPRDVSLATIQAKLDALYNAGHVVTLLVDPSTGSIVDANDAACRFYGYSRDEITRLKVSDINTAGRDEIAAAMQRARSSAETTFTFQHRLASGAIRDVELSTGPVVIDGRQLLYSFVQDVTARREAAEREERIQRLYAAMAEIDHRIARIDDPEALFREACRIAVQVAGFRMAWVGRVDETSPIRAIEAVVVEGEHGGVLDGIRVAASEDVPEGRGSMGRAVREGRTVVIDDVAADQGMSFWRDLVVRQGYRAIAALPLVVPGRPPHVVAVYSGIVGAFGSAEVGLLERMVDDVAFRLRVLDSEVARRSAEDALRASEERYRSLVEQAPDGIFVLDPRGRLLDATRAACTLLGYSLEHLRGRPAEDLLPPRLRPEAATALTRMQEIRPLAIDYERPDGRQLALEVSARRLADGRIQGVLRDVTATRSAEQERDRLAAAVEQVAESVAILDCDGRILYVNPAFEALSGYSRDEAVGESILIVRTGLLPKDEYESIDATPFRGTSWSGRVRNRRKDGETYEIDLVCSPIRDRWGEIVGSVEVGRDTSQERELEAQLAEAQRLEAMGRLAGGVAHDFNNLLTAISGYAQLAIADLGEEASVRADIEEIGLAASRAAGLTRQLLAFSRRQLLQPRVVEVRTVVEGIAPMLRRLIGEDVRMLVLCEPGGHVMVDPGQLEQVVMNLVVNSRDAMPHGGSLAIESAPADLTAADVAAQPGIEPGPFVRLSVTDTGTGIERDVLDHIFEPFFTTKERGKGTGLGLSMVFGIVRQSNGFVTVDSTVGRGSTFSVFLPRVPGASEDGERSDAAVGPTGGTETVLVVEDEMLVQTFARRILERQGYRVLTASGGEEALAIAAREGYAIDLLFTDRVMPSMGGRELADRLRAIRPDLPVLYASGYSEDLVSGAPDGGAHLPKPYAAEDLLARVRDLLATRNAGA